MGLRGSGRDAVNRAVGGMPHALTARQAVGGGRAKMVGARAVSQHLKPPLRDYFGFCHPNSHEHDRVGAAPRGSLYALPSGSDGILCTGDLVTAYSLRSRGRFTRACAPNLVSCGGVSRFNRCGTQLFSRAGSVTPRALPNRTYDRARFRGRGACFRFRGLSLSILCAPVD